MTHVVSPMQCARCNVAGKIQISERMKQHLDDVAHGQFIVELRQPKVGAILLILHIAKHWHCDAVLQLLLMILRLFFICLCISAYNNQCDESIPRLIIALVGTTLQQKLDDTSSQMPKKLINQN